MNLNIGDKVKAIRQVTDYPSNEVLMELDTIATVTATAPITNSTERVYWIGTEEDDFCFFEDEVKMFFEKVG